ncbi:MAG: hypothetical protein NTZ16_09235 [Verrucomicrobia bacterium]|nr:hypothetical protein [Verrucomicrobiota bacterium]
MLLVASLWAWVTAEAGNIRGQVRVTGAPPAAQPTPENAGAETAEPAKTNLTGFRDFIVFIDGVTNTNSPPRFRPVTILVRRNARQEAIFSPRVLPLLIGTTVEWRNEDSVYHKFFSLSATATFEFPLCKPGDSSPPWTFDRPGRVDVFCSLYANLNSIVLVMENPWFTGTDFRNNYFIRNVPAGNYRLKVWHERLPAQTREITVPAEGEVKIDFLLNLANLPAN